MVLTKGGRDLAQIVDSSPNPGTRDSSPPPHKHKPRRAAGVCVYGIENIAQFALRRLANPIPARPGPSKESVAGSGVVVTMFKVMTLNTMTRRGDILTDMAHSFISA